MIVDHFAQLDVPNEQGNNELQTLESLRLGLGALHGTVASYELAARNAAPGRRVTAFGFTMPAIDLETTLLLPCLFHWFGTTAINYARLVGYLHGLANGEYSRGDLAARGRVAAYCQRYVESVPELESVLYWRNKVFAHFAITDPHRLDSAGLLDVSTMHPVAYFNDRFRLGGVVASVQGDEVEMPSWSLTETFENLAPRFWPFQES
ncbi:MAG TPA: hypothetical protein VGK17_05780 [Propionicimonas sp.]